MKCKPPVRFEPTKTRKLPPDAFREGYFGDVRFRGVLLRGVPV